MARSSLHKLIALALLVGPLAAAVYGQALSPPAATEAIRVVTLKNADGQELAFTDEAPPIGEYWIGIALGELPPVAMKQLQLDHGLVVEEVLPDSPAQKAGFQQHDVLLQAGDKELSEPADILQAVEAAKESELTLEVVRGGERLKLKVTPVKRPLPVVESRPADEAAVELREQSIKKIEEALAELKSKSGGQSLGLYFARPGVVATTVKEIELPKDMRIVVTTGEKEPVQIQVYGDGKEWNVAADKLSELPENVRRHVEQLLGKVMHPLLGERSRQLVRSTVRLPAATQQNLPSVTLPGPPLAPQVLHAYRVKEHDSTVDEKLNQILKIESLQSQSLDALQEEVKRLRKEVDELRGK